MVFLGVYLESIVTYFLSVYYFLGDLIKFLLVKSKVLGQVLRRASDEVDIGYVLRLTMIQ